MRQRKTSRKYSSAFKLQVTLSAMKGDKTAAKLRQEFSIVSSQLYAWKKELQARGVEIFETKSPGSTRQAEVNKLHIVIGKLKVENDFLERAIANSH